MKEDIEFQEIGKRTSYKVPDGFFEQISEKTLRRAKEREQSSRKILIALRTFAVAASLSAIALLAYFMTETEKTEIGQLVQNKQTEVKDTLRQTDVIVRKITVSEIKEEAPLKTIVIETKPEEIIDVLSELSDDELLQLAAMYKSDLFIAEQ